MEDCKPCPFGTTSQPGTATAQNCEAASQPCPIGQIAPAGSVSAEQCACKPGFGGKSCCLVLYSTRTWLCRGATVVISD